MIRLKTGETIDFNDYFFGKHLVYQPIPDGEDPSVMEEFEVSDDLPRIPYTLWCSLVTLFVDYSDQQLEVHSRFLYNEEKNEWKVIIPKQQATASHVDYNYSQSVDLITGESINYPVDVSDYDCVWQIHSHNTMTLKEPSGVDDTDELKVRSGYGIISHITKDSYVVQFTVVNNNGRKNKRYFIPDNQVWKVVEGLGTSDCYLIDRLGYSSKVTKYITRWVAPVITKFPVKSIPITDWNIGSSKNNWDNLYSTNWDSRVWDVNDEIADIIRIFGYKEVKEALENYERNTTFS